MVKPSHPRNPNQTTYFLWFVGICRAKVNCQIRKFKITKLKQQVMPTYCHFDSTDVTENAYSRNQLLGRQRRGRSKTCSFFWQLWQKSTISTVARRNSNRQCYFKIMVGLSQIKKKSLSDHAYVNKVSEKWDKNAT
jgi:hypothetical protein